MIHRIGEGSSYDGDMELIESFVNYFNEPDKLSSELTYYYISRAMFYWRKLKEFLNEDEILKGSFNEEMVYEDKDKFVTKVIQRRNIKRIKKYKLNKNERELLESDDFKEYYKLHKPISTERIFQYFYPLGNLVTDIEKRVNRKVTKKELDMNSMDYPEMRREHILTNFDAYEKRFLKMVDILKNKGFSNKRVLSIFNYISRLNCLCIKYKSLKINSDDPTETNLEIERIFPIVNENGSFSLNTWLYAFFEEIDLVGFTTKRAFYDNNEGCSNDMFLHDIYHIRTIMEKKQDIIDNIKGVYYKILNSNITKEEKELHILVIWIIIHEEIENIISFEEDIKDIFSKFCFWSVNESNVEIISMEFKKYIDIITREDEMKVNMNIIRKAELRSSSGKFLRKMFRKIIDNVISNYDNNELFDSFGLMYLGVVYVINSIKNNFL